MSDQNVSCPACNGKGHVYPDGSSYSSWRTTCKLCIGIGEVGPITRENYLDGQPITRGEAKKLIAEMVASVLEGIRQNLGSK